MRLTEIACTQIDDNICYGVVLVFEDNEEYVELNNVLHTSSLIMVLIYWPLFFIC